MKTLVKNLTLEKLFFIALTFFLVAVIASFFAVSVRAYSTTDVNNEVYYEEKSSKTSHIERSYNLKDAIQAIEKKNADFEVKDVINLNEEENDVDPLSLISDDDYDSFSLVSEDVDPLSLISNDDYDPLSFALDTDIDEESNSLDIKVKESSIESYAKYLELNVPYVLHKDRDYSNLSENSLNILSKVVYEESHLCPFEQQAAIAGLVLNRLYAEEYPDTIFEIVSAPMQFRERYAYAPFPELNEKTKAAIECALSGIDFSCGAVAYYNPEYSSEEGITYFKTSTTMCAHIVDYMNLVLCCLNEHASETLALQKYYYFE